MVTTWLEQCEFGKQGGSTLMDEVEVEGGKAGGT